MFEIVLFIAFIVVSYLLGSFPTSLIIGKLFLKIDIRDYGSGNAGATNVARVIGWKPSLIVVLVDVFKGWFAAYFFARFVLHDHVISDPLFLSVACGSAAILGHCCPLFSGFRGGKGVGTLIGVMLAIFPLALIPCLILALLTLFTFGYVSLSSLVGSASLPLWIYIFSRMSGMNPVPKSLQVFSFMIPLFILFMHRENVKRLFQGNENQFKKVMFIGRSIFKEKNPN